jgi:hypothetical protein
LSPESIALPPTTPRAQAWIAVASRRLLSALLLLTLVAVLVPFAPRMPGVGLDPSWRFGVNQAVAQRLAFGSEILFTAGPYGAIYTRVFHPATDAMMLGGSLYLAFSYWACLVFLMRTTGRRWLLLFCAGLAGLVVAPDPLLFSYPLLAGLATFKLVFGEDRPALERRWAPWLVALLFAPIGLLPLVKGSTVFLGASIAGVCVVAFVARRRPLAALACVAAPAAMLMACWLAAGQGVSTLPGYFIGMAPIVSGYTEAMALDGNMLDVWIYLAASGLLLLSILAGRKTTRPARAFLMTVFSLYLFVAFKAGFVRHDGHAVIAGIAILFAAFQLPLAFSSKGAPLLVAVALCSWWQIDRQTIKTPIDLLPRIMVATYTDAWQGLRHRMAGDDWPNREYQASVASIRAQAAFPVLAGTTDIYSFDQAYLIASGNTWSPRPMFQSYSVYTPALAGLNRQFLFGKRAPDNIIFKVQPIDGRLPSLEDGASWPVLLQRYKPVRMRNGFLFLKKDPGAGPFVEPVRVAAGTYRLGQRIALPSSGQPVFAQIRFKPTLPGRLAAIVFKPSQLSIQLELADHRWKDFRMVAGMAESGFLISPLIEDTAEFGLLYAKPGLLDSKRVIAMRMYLPGRRSRYWQDQYEIVFSRVEAIASANVMDLYDLDAFDESLSAAPATVADACEGSIDAVNGTSASAVVSASGSLRVDGWLAAAEAKGHSGAKGRLADAVYVVLTDAQGHRTYLKTHLSPRPDVGAYFNDPAMDHAGFSTMGDITRLKGNYFLGLAMKSAGELKSCPQIRIPLSIGN